jgi:hypothetical protein
VPRLHLSGWTERPSPDCQRRAELIAMMLDRFGATATNGQTKGEQKASNQTELPPPE